jgi:two-component system, NarL family, response regulator DevR
MFAAPPSPYLSPVNATPNKNAPERRLKVLVVEDTKVWRDRLVPLVNETPGVELIWAAESLTEAREILLMVRPDVVLLDLRLPDGNGLDLLREIKKSRPEVFVVVLTALDGPSVSPSCFAAGADAFLSKSSGLVDLPELLASLVGSGQ